MDAETVEKVNDFITKNNTYKTENGNGDAQVSQDNTNDADQSETKVRTFQILKISYFAEVTRAVKRAGAVCYSL